MPDLELDKTSTGQGGDDKSDASTVINLSDAEPLVVREAKLFEAGNYADKGISVTEGDLDRIITSVNARAADGKPVPVKTGHDAPFVFGHVVECWRKGSELFGKLAFGAANWAKIEAENARKLSVGLLRDRSGLDHVGLVSQPRIADAQVFSFAQGDLTVIGDATETNTNQTLEVIPMAENKPDVPTPDEKMEYAKALQIVENYNKTHKDDVTVTEFVDRTLKIAQAGEDRLIETAKRVEAGNRAYQRMVAENDIVRFKQAGKITPATEGLARLILSQIPIEGDPIGEEVVVKFTEGDTERNIHIAEAFKLYLEKQPKVISFSELAEMEQGDKPDAETAKAMTAFNQTEDDYKKYGRR